MNKICRDEEQLHDSGLRPRSMLGRRRGWAFQGEQAWLNHNDCSPPWAARAVGGAATDVAAAARIGAAKARHGDPHARWRGRRDRSRTVRPLQATCRRASGRTTCHSSRHIRPASGHDASEEKPAGCSTSCKVLRRHCMARPVFRSLLSLDEHVTAKPTWALMLKDADGAFVLSTIHRRAHSCRWTGRIGGGVSRGVRAAQASDLLDGTFEVRMSQDAIGLGRHRIFCQDTSIDWDQCRAVYVRASTAASRAVFGVLSADDRRMPRVEPAVHAASDSANRDADRYVLALVGLDHLVERAIAHLVLVDDRPDDRASFICMVSVA